jgi:hypothetical protein
LLIFILITLELELCLLEAFFDFIKLFTGGLIHFVKLLIKHAHCIKPPYVT